jgi:uncharacterized membrane protein
MNTSSLRWLRQEWLQLIILCLPVAAALAAMPFATERVPMRWNIHGQVNWYAPKAWGLLFAPVIVLLSLGLVMAFEYADKNSRASDGCLTSHGRAVRKIRLGISLLLTGVCYVQVAAAVGWHPDTRLVLASVAILLAFVGNLFGKLKPNRYVGIRVPWTLNSENVWRRTHRVAGHLCTAGGIAVAVVALFGPDRSVIPFSLVCFVVIIIIPLLVAWHAANAERRENSASR